MDLHSLTISDVKRQFKNKKLSATELTKEYLKRIKEVEPKIKAFVTVTEERALLDAKKADEMFAKGKDVPLLTGIPFSIKDNCLTKGIRTTASSRILDTFIPPYSATLVDRLVNAGIVLLGKTNLDAWAHGSSTETSHYGATHNPWDTNKIPGGSSGGAAASVAADECLAAIGSETAGSTRQPSAWCGVVGLKPTYGRVSRYGVIAMGSSLDSPGPIVKSVEDAALILDILAGKDEMDATTSSKEVKSYAENLKTSRKMRIGIANDYFAGVDPEIVGAVEQALEVFKKQGHTVKKIKLFDPKSAIDVYTILQRSEVSSNMARYDGIRFGLDRSHFGEEAKRRIMLGTYALSAGYYDAYYKKAQKVRTIIIQDFTKAYENVDVIVGPTTPVTAPKLGASFDSAMFGELIDLLLEPSSIAGLTGISIPVGFSKEGMPIGMQIIGQQYGEETILNLAYQYEKENQWNFRKPKL
jgi:aspartyl-tRNA(Asn)/glutamyl-tRNA(Gln) amidotransferase subunit A